MVSVLWKRMAFRLRARLVFCGGFMWFAVLAPAWLNPVAPVCPAPLRAGWAPCLVQVSPAFGRGAPRGARRSTRTAPTFLAGVPSLLLDDEEEGGAGGDGGSGKDADGVALPPSLDSVRGRAGR